jgi:hypothetical protein
MDEIEQRLRETTDACIKSFENWNKQGKNQETRESLMETMHEVRKVLARLEIEIAISERDRLGTRQIPIPPHRSSRKPNTMEGVDFGEEEADNHNHNQGSGGGSFRQNDNRRHGGGGQHNRGRRPMHGGARNTGEQQPQGEGRKQEEQPASPPTEGQV